MGCLDATGFKLVLPIRKKNQGHCPFWQEDQRCHVYAIRSTSAIFVNRIQHTKTGFMLRFDGPQQGLQILPEGIHIKRKGPEITCRNVPGLRKCRRDPDPPALEEGPHKRLRVAVRFVQNNTEPFSALIGHRLDLRR